MILEGDKARPHSPHPTKRQPSKSSSVDTDIDANGILTKERLNNASQGARVDERVGMNDGLPNEDLDDDWDDDLSTDDEEWKEARKILRDERLRASGKHITTEGIDGSHGEAISPIEEVELDTDEDFDILGSDDEDMSKKYRKLYVKTSKPGELKLEIGLTFRDTTECQKE
ncbi:hypothetical protein OROGR_014227 [Orobanche gracilis]